MPAIENILDAASASEYDFRGTANPEDPLKHLFPEWVPYYKLKWAIANVLRPKRILEIGVRFGYSAAAFLDACPDAEYLGIDNDSDAFGGQKGPLEWARAITRQRNARYLITDSQQLSELPGAPYDLVHVDGQQDGIGTIHDLLLALPRARHILVDGYFWTRDNFLHVSEFFYTHRDAIESCLIIPGYAGELLITPRPSPALSKASNSNEIRSAYTAPYYLHDCGGFAAYKQDYGVSLSDCRLRSVADIAETAPVGRALDLGCGRGELSVHLSRMGYDVTAVDYSESAVQLARMAAENAIRVSGPLRLVFHCGDVNEAPLSGFYDLAVASDLIEHMSPAELDRLYSRLASHLSPHGLFVVHTFPNLWYYKYEHARLRRLARKINAYVPLEPRSRYEQLMHINEQSPKVLRRQLQAWFPHVLLWFADHDMHRPFEGLARRYSKSEMRSSADLFAVASHRPVAPEELLERLKMPALNPPVDVQLELLHVPTRVQSGSPFVAQMRIINNGPVDLKSRPPHPVHASYHCYTESRQLIVFDGLRSRIPTIRPGSTAIVDMQVAAPKGPGRFLFRFTLVQELVRWFEDPPQSLFVERWISAY